MSKVFSILKIPICLLLCIEMGCSAYPGRALKNISSGSIETDSYLDGNNSYSTPIQQNKTYDIDSLLKKNGSILTDKEPCKIKYHELNLKNRNIIVESQIGTTGNKYPAVLDTGASQAIIISSMIVRKNKLPIYPIENETIDFNGNSLGICQLSELKIDEVNLKNWPCIYLEPYGTLNFLGIPIASTSYNHENIILGLPLLREFKYIIFDNINKEVELSHSQSFEPCCSTGWKKYPISIEEDFHGNMFLFVRLSIEGYETELQLDTGSGKGLAIGERLWTLIKDELKGVKLRKGKDFYPYIGNLNCKRGKATELEFGNRTVINPEISTFSDDSPLLDGCEGLVGMQFFSNTLFVLDFEHDLMWLREQNC